MKYENFHFLKHQKIIQFNLRSQPIKFKRSQNSKARQTMKTVLFCILVSLLPLSSESPLSDQEYCELGSDHTMCQYQRAKCNKIGKGLNDDERQAILLDKHNELSRRIPACLSSQTPASNMKNWSCRRAKSV